MERRRTRSVVEPGVALEETKSSSSGKGVAGRPGWWSGGGDKRENAEKGGSGRAGFERGFGWAGGVGILRDCYPNFRKTPSLFRLYGKKCVRTGRRTDTDPHRVTKHVGCARSEIRYAHRLKKFILFCFDRASCKM